MNRSLVLAFRSLVARPARSVLTTFGIVLGVAVILAINITNASTLDSISSVFSEASGKAHLIVNSADSNGAGFSESLLKKLAKAGNVQHAVPTLHVRSMLADDLPQERGTSYLGGTDTGLVLYGIDPALDQFAREYKVVAGRFLADNRDAQEMVLVRDYADEKKIKLGRDIRIVTPDGPEIVRVVGLISQEGPGRLNNGAFGVIPLQVAQRFFGRAGDLDQIDIVAAPQATASAELDLLKAALQGQLGDDYTVTYPAAQGKRVTQMLDTYQLGLNFFSAIAIFVGAFLIYNAFSMTVVERTHEIGMLRTIGMTRRQVTRQIQIEAIILGVIGSLLGILFGILLSFGLIRMMELLLVQDLRLARVPKEGIVLSGVVGIVVTLVASSLPAWQAGRTSPLEALRSRGRQRDGWLMRWGWVVGLLLLALSLGDLYFAPLPPAIQQQMGNVAISGLFMGASLLIPATVGIWERLSRPVVRAFYGPEGRLGSRNIERAKLRTTLTVSALMIGTAMILGIRGLTSSFEHDIKAWTDLYIGGDLYVYSSLRMPLDLGRRLTAVDGVGAVAYSRSLEVKWVTPGGDRERLTFVAVDPASYRRVTSFVFADNQGDQERLMDELGLGDTVFLSTTVTEKYGIKQGDTVRLETRRGPRDFRVAAAVVDFANQGLVVHGNWQDMVRYFGLRDVDVFYVKVQPGAEPAAVKQLIEHLYGKRRHLTVQSNTDIKAQAMQTTTQAFALFDVLALISMVVAALGVINTLSMNVLERTREIGMLRGVGMTSRQVGKMILAESSVMGIIGSVFGLALGLVLARVLVAGAASVQGYYIDYVVPVQGILFSLILALVISQVAAIAPARRAARLRIVEAIQFE